MNAAPMASHRPYRTALGLDVATAEAREHPDKFDPVVATACVQLLEQGRIEL
jgi:HD-GYP domain-containing protein (c-di-GMP phosphodiesterase class II)